MLNHSLSQSWRDGKCSTKTHGPVPAQATTVTTMMAGDAPTSSHPASREGMISMLTSDQIVKLALLVVEPNVKRIDFNKSNDTLFVNAESVNLETYQEAVESVRDIVKDAITNWYTESRQEDGLIKSWWCGPELQVSIFNFAGFVKEKEMKEEATNEHTSRTA